MPMQEYIRVLCYEHHVEMRLRQVLLKAQPESGNFLPALDRSRIAQSTTIVQENISSLPRNGTTLLCIWPAFRRGTSVTGDIRI